MQAVATCPLCSGSSSPAFTKKNYDFRDCGDCNHRFVSASALQASHVDTVYGDTYFLDGGAGYSDYLGEEKLLRARGRQYASILSKYTGPGKILDVGAAAGFVLKGLVDSGWTGNGIEPNAKMASLARTRLGLEVWTGMLESLADDLTFDAVSMIQVLPHFVDPVKAIQVVAKVTRPGGLLLIETWNRSSWTARLMGKNWHEYSPPSVLHWFDPEGVAALCGQAGYLEIGRGRPFKRIMSSHAKSLLRHTVGTSLPGRLASRAINIVPDHWTLPYPAEDLFWILLRKQG